MSSEQPSSGSSYTTLGYLRAAREWAYPTLKKSAFLEKGVLTPEEFVLAGDELVFRCPTWSWEAGDPSRAKPYLPLDKQFLVTRNVPCQNRVSSMEQQLDMQQGYGDDDDWLVSSILRPEDIDKKIEEDFDILDETGEVVEKPAAQMELAAQQQAGASEEGDNQDDEYADMADFEDDNVIQDDAVVADPAKAAAGDYDENDNLIKVRTYDLSITYDKYYQTPRVWMVGKSAEGQPLKGEQMMEDVITDYANKTVTIEAHPHVSGPHASIHPCQHGKVMKVIVRNLIKAHGQTKADGDEEGQGAPSVEMYLFIFLKFVSSIIPTINYDFTMDVTASTSK